MTAATLHGFAYGEHLDGPQQRSLGFRLLSPVEPVAWSAEVEALARSLQGAPYPDQWPPADLFCSVLLADGQRVVAVARYGLADHTPSRRRSGLELLGVVGPGSLGVSSALAVARWLRQRRGGSDDLRSLAGTQVLADVLAAAPPEPPASEPVPVLPIRLWQEGALLFAATSPSDPDRRLGLLEQGTADRWQWLPLVGPDFPLPAYARRGPLVAWTPHLAGVALKLDRRSTEATERRPAKQGLIAVVAAVLCLLLGANLWATLALPGRLPSAPVVEPRALATIPGVAAPSDASRERFAQGLYHVLKKRGALTESNQSRFIAQYEDLVVREEVLRVNSTEGKAAVGAVHSLAQRGPLQVEAMVRDALADKGYDPELVNRACALVRDRLNAETKAPR